MCVVLVVAACGGGSGIGGGDDTQPDAATDGDGGTQAGWTTLIERNWQLDPITEAFKCVRVKVPADTYIAGFRVKSPPGTHHELLTISTNPGSVGPYECDATNTDQQMLFAGGIATDPLVFPTGVAIKVPKDTYINLNLHVANFTDNPISGTSGIEVKTVAASDVVNEAEAIFIGTFDIHIPPNSVDVPQYASCSIPAEWHVLNFWPHMHSYGTHQKISVKRISDGQDQMLLDQPYSYTDQKNYPMQNMLLHQNDMLELECKYTNPTSNEIQYADSAIGEMCFAGFYKWPSNNLPKYFCAPDVVNP
jgi:hypothetical protein